MKDGRDMWSDWVIDRLEQLAIGYGEIQLQFPSHLLTDTVGIDPAGHMPHK
jgi:hypothetical protein